MSTRITTGMVTGTELENINRALTSIQRTSAELSSGNKILEPSDDPYGASHIVDLQSQLEGLVSYANNTQDGIAWENTAGGAMAGMQQAVQRVRELLLSAANGTKNQSDREKIALEVEQMTEAIKGDANTKYGDQFVFAGTLTTTLPYEQGANDEYKGNAETIARAIGPGASVTISTNVSELLGNGQASKDGLLLDTLRTITEHLRSGNPAEVAALNSTDLKTLDGNIEVLNRLQASAGSATQQLTQALARNEAFQGSISEGLRSTASVDIATASMNWSNEQAAYQAALRAGASIIQESLLNFLH
jgi:flagellar hook-associated protein 3 FlgL